MALRQRPAVSIVDELYAGAMDGSRWYRAMLRIVDSLRGSCGGLFSFDPSCALVLRDEGYGVAAENMLTYREWVAAGLDPRRDLGVSKPVFEASERSS